MDVIAYVFTVLVALDHPQLPHTSFVVAAEHRTFCEAMREMYSTDPAVSVSSKCVESRVKVDPIAKKAAR